MSRSVQGQGTPEEEAPIGVQVAGFSIAVVLAIAALLLSVFADEWIVDTFFNISQARHREAVDTVGIGLMVIAGIMVIGGFAALFHKPTKP